MEIKLRKDSNDLANEFFKLSTPEDVADLLEIPYKVLNYHLYIKSPSLQYKTFTIPKKTGGTREISAPVTPIKIIQRKLNTVLQNVCKDIYKKQDLVHGFRYGKSVCTNAKIHEKKEYVFNIDLLDFFPSINFGRVYGMFKGKRYKLPEKVAAVLARICCYNNQLPQGAPTSPIVSNMICARLDNELYRLARSFDCRYTRYADDITFSTDRPEFPAELADVTQLISRSRLKAVAGKELNAIVEKNGFLINTCKVRIQNRHGRQCVTGLIVNEFPNVSRKYTNQIRAMLHSWKVDGLAGAEKKFLEKNNKKRWPFESGNLFRQVVKGKINFLKMVRGNQNATYQKFCEQLASFEDSNFSFFKILANAEPDNLEQAVFVLESPRCQGTAFMLFGVGIVTTAHNLENDGFDTYLHKAGQESDKKLVRVKHIDTDLDLAIIEVDKGWAMSSLCRGDSTSLSAGDPVKVVGFPKYIKDKTVQIHDGKITGYGHAFGTDAINISARVIYGNCGGPVLNANNEVVGIAFLGASGAKEADSNESGIIPIEKLDTLKALKTSS